MFNKKNFSGFFIALLFISHLTFAAQADTEYIPRDKYFDTALNEINSAKGSVRVFMYLVSLNPKDLTSKPAQLLNALVQAKDRGVDVRVVLDQNIEFVNDDIAPRNKNQNAYTFLKEHSVPVFFDESSAYTHAKVIVIDGEVVILGSTNWSKAALTKNHEASAIVRSKEFAQSILKDLSSIEIREVSENITATVSVPVEFLTDGRFLGRMVEKNAERAFDIYLYLLKEYDGNPGKKVTVKYDDLAKSLGIEKMTSEAYRRQIIKVLEKLESEYGLIQFKPVYAKDAEVVLRSSSTDKPLKVSANYWDYGWDHTLPFAGKVMLLVNLSESAHSEHGPSWSLPVKALAGKYHVSGWFIEQGTTALRRANLLEVEYAPLDRNGGAHFPSTYTLRPFYDPEELMKKIRALETKWGKEKLDRAKRYAALVYEDSDINGVEMLIELEDQYGVATVKKAADKISLKSPSNPKRTMRYLIGMVRGMGEARE